jgi:hypothetical protein
MKKRKEKQKRKKTVKQKRWRKIFKNKKSMETRYVHNFKESLIKCLLITLIGKSYPFCEESYLTPP